MTYTSPWAVGFEPRLDKKCGASAIPDNATCRKGTGAATPGGSRVRRGLENAAIYGGTIGSLGLGIGALHSLSNFDLKTARNRIRGAQALGVVSGIGGYSKGKRLKDKERVQEAEQQLAATAANIAFSEGGNMLARSLSNKIGPNRITTRINPKPSSRSGSAGKYRMANMRANIENRVARAQGNAEGFVGGIRNRIGTIGYSRRSGPPRHSGYLPTSQAAPLRPRGRGRSGPWSAYGA